MALINCPECNKEISELAPTCPQCGAPTKAGAKQAKKEKTSKRGNIQGAGCLIIILAIVCSIFFPVGAILLGVTGVVVLIAGLFA